MPIEFKPQSIRVCEDRKGFIRIGVTKQYTNLASHTDFLFVRKDNILDLIGELIEYLSSHKPE